MPAAIGALREAVEGAEDNSLRAQEDLAQRGFSPADTLVGIAASGRTPYVLAGIAFARELGAWTIGLSCVPGSSLAGAVDLAITPNTGAEVVTGSTRMKAGTATKLVLNMLSTGLMVRLGYVYGNLMVNVQPTNVKLRDRAERIVQRLTGLPAADAATLLRRAGSVRIATIMYRLGIDQDTAEKRLAAVGGRLRDVLEGHSGGLIIEKHSYAQTAISLRTLYHPYVTAAFLSVCWVLCYWSPWLPSGSRTAWFEASAWGATHGLGDLAISSKVVTGAVACLSILGALLRLSVAVAGSGQVRRQVGMFLTCTSLSLVMPAAGAGLFLSAVATLSLIRWVGSRGASQEQPLSFGQRLLAESFPLLVAVSMVTLSWQYNSQLLTRGLLVAAGLALLGRAALPAEQTEC